jgi:translation initiation factor eIF-2B subunit delta
MAGDGGATAAESSEKAAEEYPGKHKLTKAERRAQQEAQRARKAEQSGNHVQQKSSHNQRSGGVPRPAGSRALAMTERLRRGNRSVDDTASLLASAPGSDSLTDSFCACARSMASGELACERERALALADTLNDAVAMRKDAFDNSSAQQAAVRELLQHLDFVESFLSHCTQLGCACSNLLSIVRKHIAHLAENELSGGAHDIYDSLVSFISSFKQQRLTLALERILDNSIGHIVNDNETILTSGYSDVVEYVLLKALDQDVHFDVHLIGESDSPAVRRMAESLLSVGIDVTFTHTSGAAYAARSSSRALLGVSAVYSNGSVQASSGAHVLCACAQDAGIKVHALCETLKFVDKAVCDSTTSNEVDGSRQAAKNARNIAFMSDVVPGYLLESLATEHGYFAPAPNEMVQMLQGRFGVDE